jgi:single-stranded-DNA-specific exonuclease
VRRGLGDPEAARAWLAARDAHDPSAFAGIDDAVQVVRRHVAAGSRITIHGDYDVDGVCSTAILVRTLRSLGADVDWYLPSRTEDGYGLAAATVQRLAARGTRLLVTADCAITAVEEVAAARAAGMDVVVTDHHAPRADGLLPDAPLVHPALCGYPCPELCAAGVAHKLALALLAAGGADPATAHEDLDLVALATVADCVPLVGENRRLVREGLRALALTRKPGLRALLRVARVDPSRVDATSIGFRLAPRINAAGRMQRADAGLELVLTQDEARAAEIAEELDRLNGDRRHTEQRILFAAEGLLAAAGEQPGYVLAADDWHPGVIGIVASRLAERHHRPVVLVALDGEQGTGSGRSIPAFDLLGGLEAASAHLLRHGGHRAAAGCTVARGSVDAFRAAFAAHAAATLSPEDLVPRERVDAVVAGDELGAALAEELGRLAPFGMGNPRPSLLVPGARLTDPRPMGEGKHVRFTVQSGGARAGAVAFGTASLPDGAQDGIDATFGLELNEFNGAVEPRLVLRRACPPAPAPVTVVGEAADWRAAVLAEAAAPLERWSAAAAHGAPPSSPAPGRLVRDRRGGGVAGLLTALVASGEPVLVVAADTPTRLAGFAGRLGGFALTSWRALELDPGLAAAYPHVVALDPPAHPALQALLEAGPPGAMAHLACGQDELRFSEHVHMRLHALREPLAAVYRALRDGRELEPALRGDGPRPAPAVLAGRLLRVLDEAGLATVDRDAFTARLLDAPGPVDLERSPAYAACTARLAEGQRWLTSARPQAA